MVQGELIDVHMIRTRIYVLRGQLYINWAPLMITPTYYYAYSYWLLTLQTIIDGSRAKRGVTNARWRGGRLVTPFGTVDHGNIIM